MNLRIIDHFLSWMTNLIPYSNELTVQLAGDYLMSRGYTLIDHGGPVDTLIGVPNWPDYHGFPWSHTPENILTYMVADLAKYSLWTVANLPKQFREKRIFNTLMLRVHYLLPREHGYYSALFFPTSFRVKGSLGMTSEEFIELARATSSSDP